MIVNDQNYPQLRSAFKAIEEDNGGHLIGTVYPGEKIDLHNFVVPDAWMLLLPQAEAGLQRLHDESKDDLETFVTGEMSEAEAIETRQSDLAAARQVLNDYFNGWQPEDAPQAGVAA
jgi:hypothetical protein